LYNDCLWFAIKFPSHGGWQKFKGFLTGWFNISALKIKPTQENRQHILKKHFHCFSKKQNQRFRFQILLLGNKNKAAAEFRHTFESKSSL